MAIAASTLPTVTVAVNDQYGNLITGDHSNVTMTLASGNGMLSKGDHRRGRQRPSPPSATFSIDRAGTYTFRHLGQQPGGLPVRQLYHPAQHSDAPGLPPAAGLRLDWFLWERSR